MAGVDERQRLDAREGLLVEEAVRGEDALRLPAGEGDVLPEQVCHLPARFLQHHPPRQEVPEVRLAVVHGEVEPALRDEAQLQPEAAGDRDFLAGEPLHDLLEVVAQGVAADEAEVRQGSGPGDVQPRAVPVGVVDGC